MDTELNQFNSLDHLFNLIMEGHPDVSTQFENFSHFWTVMRQREPNFFAQVNTFDDYFNWLKQRDPNLFAQFKSSDHFSKVMKQSNPNFFALKLAKRVATPSIYTVHYREMCTDLLRKLLTEDLDLCTWQNLPVSTQSTIKTTLLDRIMIEESRYISVKLRSIVVKLAPSLISGNNNSWPELFSCLYQCVTSSTSPKYAKISAFAIFKDLADQIGETVFSSLKDSLHSVLRITLNDDTLNLDVRVAAMSAAINFILCVSSSNEKERFQYLLPGMMKTLIDSATSTEEEPFFEKEIPITYLIMLAKRDPRFLRMQLVDVVFTVLEMVEGEYLGEKVRREGVEFLLTLVEAKKRAPGMMKKLPLFIVKGFAMLLNLLVLDIKDDPAWHSAEILHDKAGTTTTFLVGCDGLRRYSRALGRKSIAHEAKEQLSAYLVAPEWEKRHAALFALSYIAEGCIEVITKNLDTMMSMVLKCLQDPHPRVRWAACWTIDVFFHEFGPHVQEEYHNQAYLALSVVLDDFHPRVQASATLALSVICMSYKPEALIPHLDEIVNKLLVLLQNEKPMVLRQTLKSFTLTAQSVKEHFRTYYDTVVPHLKGVLGNADLKYDLSLRSSAVECIIVIGLAVGKKKFREDAKQIMEVFMPLQELQERADDFNAWEMLRSYVRICKCMGKKFLPYLSAVIPLLIQCAKWHDENHGVDDNSIEKVMFRDKTIWEIHYYHLKEKVARACDGLYLCADILNEDFYPWIPKAVSVLVPLLKFHSNNHVRKHAVKAMISMLRCAKLAVEKGVAQGGSESYFTELSDYIIKALVKALHKEQVVELCVIMLYELNNCLQICGPPLHEGLVRSIVDEIKHIITHSSSRKQEFIERENFEDFDDEEAELLEDERLLEGEIFFYVCKVLRTLIEAFKAVFLPFFDELSSSLLPMLAKEKTIASERFNAIGIFTDLVVKCPRAAGMYYEVYFPLILGISDDEDPLVRENALYGLRLWAEYGHSSFKHFVGEALLRINKVIMHSKALEPENEIAYNFAVSALGMIFELHGEGIDLAKVIPVWLNCLPIKADLFEAKLVHKQLCLMAERSQKELFGPSNQYTPKIVSIFAEVLCSNNDLTTEETAFRIINVLRHLHQTIPAATLLSELSYLLPQHEMELKSILSLDEDAN